MSDLVMNYAPVKKSAKKLTPTSPKNISPKLKSNIKQDKKEDRKPSLQKKMVDNRRSKSLVNDRKSRVNSYKSLEHAIYNKLKKKFLETTLSAKKNSLKKDKFKNYTLNFTDDEGSVSKNFRKSTRAKKNSKKSKKKSKKNSKKIPKYLKNDLNKLMGHSKIKITI